MPITADIYYYEFSDSNSGIHPPVVLIHGAGGNHLYWPPNIRRLPGYKIYSLDLPGHGKSTGRGRQSINAYVQDTARWLAAVKLNRAVFIGHSMGGAIAVSLALQYPEHVLGLGLISTGASLQVHPDLMDSTSSQTTFNNAVVNIIRMSFSSHASERMVELATHRMLETRQSVLHGDFQACNAFDETLSVSRIKKPALIICGAQDRMTPARYSHYLSSKLTASELSIIPDAGHMVMLEKPQTVSMEINKFLTRIVL